MRAYEEFSGIQVLTFCIMSNHFHLVLRVPHRPAVLPSDEELVRLLEVADHSYGSATLAQELKLLRQTGNEAAAERLRERFFSRMWKLSPFMQSLKQRFTQWYNGLHHHAGTVWASRFKNVVVECSDQALAAVAAYVDLNPVRAGMVNDPARYRWCGYGEAAAGKQLARAGLRLVMEARMGVAGARWGAGLDLSDPGVLAEYRGILFEKGEARAAGEDGSPARKGFTPEQVEEVIKSGGKLPAYEWLRCRVRYFCDGVALGSKAFIENFFRANRAHFSARRKEGARPLRHVDLADCYSMRALRIDPVTRHRS